MWVDSGPALRSKNCPRGETLTQLEGAGNKTPLRRYVCTYPDESKKTKRSFCVRFDKDDESMAFLLRTRNLTLEDGL